MEGMYKTRTHYKNDHYYDDLVWDRKNTRNVEKKKGLFI